MPITPLNATTVMYNLDQVIRAVRFSTWYVLTFPLPVGDVMITDATTVTRIDLWMTNNAGGIPRATVDPGVILS